jgi:hypothetical protein
VHITAFLILNCVFLTGLHVAEIRAIFTLPSQLGNFSQPLAYIHWFKPFNAWDSELGMYKLSRSTRQRRPNAAIICVNQIVQSCHLLPKFGSEDVPRHGFNGNVLNHASDFLFNRYLDFYIFEEFAPDGP